MIMRSMKRFVHDETGATALEYGLIAALVVTAIVGSVTLLGANAGTSYVTLATKVR